MTRRSVSLLGLVACSALHGAAALVVPLSGWTPIAGDASRWQDAGGACLIREDRYGQAFPQLSTQAQATATANRLRASLLARGLSEVVTQPVERQGGGWAVLAAYGYHEGGVTYRVSQLFTSQSGILHTVSGSSALNNTSTCAAAMREFIRYSAN